MKATRPPFELDIENLNGYFEVKLTDKRIGKVYSFPMYRGRPLNIPSLSNILSGVTIYTFNGNNYDLPILNLALYGADNKELKKAGDAIIQGGMKPWDFYKHFGIEPLDWIDHVDLMEVAPGVQIGLKMYGCRMHAPLIQDIPVDVHNPIAPSLFASISSYCDNDLDTTHLLRDGLAERLNLRIAIGKRYGIDVRSKSDAQIAEAVIKSEIIRLRKEAYVQERLDAGLTKEQVDAELAQVKFYIDRRYIPHGYTFQYTPPPHIRFVTPELNELLDVIRNASFLVADKEEQIEMGILDPIKTGVKIPAELKGRDIRIGNGVYRMGIGGLHSQEESVSHYAIDGVCTLRDVDVKSYYPFLIRTQGMAPEQLADYFLEVFGGIVDRRIFAKDEAKRIFAMWEAMGALELKVEADELDTEAGGLKIVANGTFGKLFSKYSIMFAPELGIAVTVTGQLSLLMLIEMMELSGMSVLSANTDGIVLRIPSGLDGIASDVVKWWERTTGLEMEDSHYKALHSRDVNNYIAITTKGKVKRKGVFAPPGLIENKHPDKAICADAVAAYLKDGTPIEDTINACTDIRQFLQVRRVKGGGVYRNLFTPDEYLGRAVRWYKSSKAWDAYIVDQSSGNKVAGSDSVVPIMRLPDEFPSDVDMTYYINTAYEMLADVGIEVVYWYHAESDCVLISFPWESERLTAAGCDEISRKAYDKRK